MNNRLRTGISLIIDRLWNSLIQGLQRNKHHRWGVWVLIIRANSRFAPSQWETALFCNDVSHWLGAKLESALIIDITRFLVFVFLNKLIIDVVRLLVTSYHFCIRRTGEHVPVHWQRWVNSTYGRIASCAGFVTNKTMLYKGLCKNLYK